MAEVYEPYGKSVVRPLLVCMAAAALVAIFADSIASLAMVQKNAVRILPSLVRFVPSVAQIASETANNEASEIILLAQWLFAPVYAFVWFYTAPPWTPRMRYTVRLTNRTIPSSKRVVAWPIGILFLGAWALGDLGVISFPTFYNGKYAYPLDHAVPQVKVIYGSPFALAVYAWLGPICEVCVFWMLAMLIVNAKTYLSADAAR
jgi:hypothetical protein